MRVLYILAALLLVAPMPAAGLELEETVFASRQLGIRLEAPNGWTVTRQTGYPSVPALLLHQKPTVGGEPRPTIRLAFGAEGTGARLRDFLRHNLVGIEAVGIRFVRSDEIKHRGRSVLRVQLLGKEGKIAHRQLYLSHGSRALVLTLAAASSRIQSFDFDLRRTLELIELTRPTSRTLEPADTVSYPSPGERQDVESKPNRPASRPAPPTSKPAAAPAPSRELELEGLEPGEGPR